MDEGEIDRRVREMVQPQLTALGEIARLLLTDLHRRDPAQFEVHLHGWQQLETQATDDLDRKALRIQVFLLEQALSALPP